MSRHFRPRLTAVDKSARAADCTARTTRTSGDPPPHDSDSSHRNVHRDGRAPSRDFKALADALPHSYPATTERDGNTVIADAKKTVKKAAYLIHVAANMTSYHEADVTDDSQDYFEDSSPTYSRPGDSDSFLYLFPIIFIGTPPSCVYQFFVGLYYIHNFVHI